MEFYSAGIIDMAMTQRERYLAIGVGLVVGAFGLQYVVNSMRSSLQMKQDLADAARDEAQSMEKIAVTGKLAARKLEMLAPKSLPTNQEALVAQYRNWLFKLGEESGLEDIRVATPERPSQTTEAFESYDFALSGKSRKDQVVDLLARYYDRDYLHTVRTLKLNQTKDPDILDVVLESRALSLSAADPKQQPSTASSGRLAMSAEEYKKTILNRNPFSPPNQAPKISSSSSHTVERGKNWSLNLEAKDPESHRVEFEMVSTDLPEGLRFNNGSLSWEPSENGEYEVLVRAMDNGWPSKSTEQKLVISVVDPPKEEPKVEPPKFDVATQAFVSALLRGRSGPEAWIRSRTDGKTLQLSEGADFELGSIKAKVIGINLDEDFVELESDGARWTIGMDTSLADAYNRSKID